MKSLSLSRYALSLSVAAVFLAGCGGSAFKVAPNEIPAQPQTESAAMPAQVSARRPTKAEFERWSSMMQRVPDPGYGCLKAIYPERQWREIRCGKSPNVLFLIAPPQAGAQPTKVGGGGSEYFAWPIGGHTTAAKGWFPNVIGVRTEYSTGTTSKAFDYYSLQVNTNAFATPTVCAYYGSPNKNCKGQEQFVFFNEGNNSGNDGSLFMEYVLDDYAPCGSQTCTNTCPSGWQGAPQGNNTEACYMASSNSDDVQSESISWGLNDFTLGGASPARSSTSDYVTLVNVGRKLTHLTGNSPV